VSTTLQHKLQQFKLGMVWLDAANRVQAFNDIAWEILAPASEHTLGVPRGALHGMDLLQLHPDKSRSKIALLLQQGIEAGAAPGCPVKSPPPVTMMINIPDRVLLLQVSKMFGEGGMQGTCMVFYDLTDVTTHEAAEPGSAAAAQRPASAPRLLKKVPVYRANRLMLIDLAETIRLESNDHYTWIVTASDRYLSNLSLSDLEERLSPDEFFRCHRSHIIHVSHIRELEKTSDSYKVLFDGPGEASVPVSRDKVAELKRLLGLP
jgi:hypothetical protein